MGGNGASSGMSKKGNKYGTQFHTLLEVDNIKFVSKNERESESLLETMTSGRIYVEVGGEDLLRIIQFDENNKRNHVIERDKRTDKWHAHNGYYHAEKGKARHEALNEKDEKLLEKVKSVWYNTRGT